MRLLSSYEMNALAAFEEIQGWVCAADLGRCRLATLNKLHQKGLLLRRRLTGKYQPSHSILFKRRNET